jgi:hypothetical protein
MTEALVEVPATEGTTAMCHNDRRRSYFVTVLLAGVLQLCAFGVGAEDEESLDRTPQDCISTSRIRETDVIDDRTILFRMRGGDVYSNILDRECPGLGRNKRFMHETRGGRLCDIDTITVLEQWTGRLSEGFTCRLGKFHPITQIEAEDLELGPDVAAARERDVEVREVDLPPDESAGDSEPEPEPQPD